MTRRGTTRRQWGWRYVRRSLKRSTRLFIGVLVYVVAGCSLLAAIKAAAIPAVGAAAGAIAGLALAATVFGAALGAGIGAVVGSTLEQNSSFRDGSLTTPDAARSLGIGGVADGVPWYLDVRWWFVGYLVVRNWEHLKPSAWGDAAGFFRSLAHSALGTIVKSTKDAK